MIAKIRRDWDEFFFGLRSATPLGLFRILLGIMVLSWCVLIYPDLKTWYTEDGVFPLAAMKAWNLDPVGFNVFAMRSWTQTVFGHGMFSDVTNFGFVLAGFWFLVVAASMLTVGYKSRFASIVVALLLVSFHHRDAVILNGGDTLMRNMALLLTLSNSGAAVSVDRLISIWRGKSDSAKPAMMEAWPQRLMQLQLAGVYLSTVMSKITGDLWRDGTAYAYSSQLTDLQRFSMHGLNHVSWFFIFSSYYSIFAEFSMATMVFSRRLRPYALVMGLFLHAGIEYSMVVPLFAFTITSCYMNFVPQQWLDSWAAKLHGKFSRFTLSLPESYFSISARNLMGSLDSIKLLTFTSGEANAVSPHLLNRAFWRFPATWALAFTPLIDVILIRALPWFLITAGIIWPLIVWFAVKELSARAYAAWSTGDSGTLDSRLTSPGTETVETVVPEHENEPETISV